MKVLKWGIALNGLSMVACVGMILADASQEPRLLDSPELLFGKSDPKWVCQDACQAYQETGGSCGPLVCGGGEACPCDSSRVGYICGEERKERETRLKCIQDPAGSLDECVNDASPVHCIKFRYCKCKDQAPNYPCSNASGDFTNCGSVNKSDDCPTE